MIAAPTPLPALTLAQVALTSAFAVKTTLKQTGSPGHTNIKGCRLTTPHYGECHFSLVYTSKLTGVKFNCAGVIRVRNIGHGFEKTYGVVKCNGKRVN